MYHTLSYGHNTHFTHFCFVSGYTGFRGSTLDQQLEKGQLYVCYLCLRGWYDIDFKKCLGVLSLFSPTEPKYQCVHQVADGLLIFCTDIFNN